MKHSKKTTYLLFIFLLFTLTFISIVDGKSKQVLLEQERYNMLPTLIIDAGHGGEDGGAVASDGTVEKNINLAIALQTNEFANLLGFNTIMTRANDDALSDSALPTIRERKMSDINARMEILNQNKDAYLVSIHQNQFSDRTCKGMQVFYSTNNKISQSIANAIQSYTKQNLQTDNNREVKASTKDIYILYHTENPAIMVECGFMSNKNELIELKNQTYGTKLSLCILSGIMNHLNAERIL